MNSKMKPLYRKVNTTCLGGKIYHGNNKKYNRGKKESIKEKSKMKSGKQYHGLDFSPLYGFLRKNVGQNWSKLHSEIIQRIPKHNKQDPLEDVVISYNEFLEIEEENLKKEGYFRAGESSYYSKFYIDENDNLQYVCKELSVNNIVLSFSNFTNTFNGKVVHNKK